MATLTLRPIACPRIGTMEHGAGRVYQYAVEGSGEHVTITEQRPNEWFVNRATHGKELQYLPTFTTAELALAALQAESDASDRAAGRAT